jgi:muramoyltetrapeptide carboxypeptidase
MRIDPKPSITPTKSKALPAGGTIGVIAPASSAHARSSVLRGVRSWESAGYRVKVSPQAYATDGYLAGSEAQRAQALMEMFTAPDVDAIQVVHGGFGSSKIIPLLDFQRIRQHPKPLIGRSDITALHLAFARLAGLVTFYGPGLADMVAPRGSEFTASAARRAVTSTDALGTLPVHPSDPFLMSIRGGRVTAPLVGGCLWPLCKTIGTPWQPDLRGKVLFVEEVGEPPWSIDAHLTHLSQARVLDGVAGIVIGRLKNCDWSEERPECPSNLALDEVLERHLAPLGVPVLHGVPIGHEADTLTIPLGVQVTLDADAVTLSIDEPGVQ